MHACRPTLAGIYLHIKKKSVLVFSSDSQTKLNVYEKKCTFFFRGPPCVYLEYITSGSKQSLNFRVWGGLVIENKKSQHSLFELTF